MSVGSTHLSDQGNCGLILHSSPEEQGGSSYLLLAVSAEQDDEHEQQDDTHAHDEQREVWRKGHDQEHRPHLGCWLIVDSRRLYSREAIID